jgi:hypothetical protein
MKGSDGGFVQAYNAQAVVDDHSQIIIAADLTDMPPDSHNLIPMLRQAAQNCGRPPAVATADAGYWNPEVMKRAEDVGSQVLVALTRESKKQSANAPPETTAARQQMAEILAAPENRKLYRKRKATVEPVFGQIKEARGFRQFSFRGVVQVRAEWLMVALCHNIRKLFMASRAPQPA